MSRVYIDHTQRSEHHVICDLWNYSLYSCYYSETLCWCMHMAFTGSLRQQWQTLSWQKEPSTYHDKRNQAGIMAKGSDMYHGKRIRHVSWQKDQSCIMAKGPDMYHGKRISHVSWQKDQSCIMGKGLDIYILMCGGSLSFLHDPPLSDIL